MRITGDGSKIMHCELFKVVSKKRKHLARTFDVILIFCNSEIVRTSFQLNLSLFPVLEELKLVSFSQEVTNEIVPNTIQDGGSKVMDVLKCDAFCLIVISPKYAGVLNPFITCDRKVLLLAISQKYCLLASVEGGISPISGFFQRQNLGKTQGKS